VTSLIPQLLFRPRSSLSSTPIPPSPSVSSSSSLLSPESRPHVTGKLGSPTPDWAYLEERAQHFSAHLKPNCSTRLPHSPYLPLLPCSRRATAAVNLRLRAVLHPFSTQIRRTDANHSLARGLPAVRWRRPRPLRRSAA
jgi:hypothetical protein